MYIVQYCTCRLLRSGPSMPQASTSTVSSLDRDDVLYVTDEGKVLLLDI